MKELTEEQFLQAPSKIQVIYLSGLYDITIPLKLYQEAVEEYPEYFKH